MEYQLSIQKNIQLSIHKRILEASNSTW